MNGILAGLKVLDLTQNAAGPYCTQVLADFGADVIKIERPGRGDDSRDWRPPEVAGQSSTFLALNRSKSSICIDIETAAGREKLMALIETADVFIHSMKPGSLEKRNLGYDVLIRRNPRLLFCEVSAFGQVGPMSSFPGYDPLMQAFSGIMSVTGNEGEDSVRVGVSLIDLGTGMWMAIGVLAAFIGRLQDGRGRRVSASLLETGLSLMTVVIASYLADGSIAKKIGSKTAMTAPYELFEAADGHVFIAAGNNHLFASVCQGLRIEPLVDDARFRDNPSRVLNRVELHRLIAARTRELTVEANIAALRAAGAPCSELNNVAQLVAHPQVDAIGMIVPLPLPGAPAHRVVALPISIDGNRGGAMRAPPALGSDTQRLIGQA